MAISPTGLHRFISIFSTTRIMKGVGVSLQKKRSDVIAR